MGKKREDEMNSILTKLLILAAIGLPVSIWLVYDHWNPQEQYVTSMQVEIVELTPASVRCASSAPSYRAV